MSCRFCGDEFTISNPAYYCQNADYVCKLCTELAHKSEEYKGNCIFCGKGKCEYVIHKDYSNFFKSNCKIHNREMTKFCSNHFLAFCVECKSHLLCGNLKDYNLNSKNIIEDRQKNFDANKASDEFYNDFDKILNENISYYKEKIKLLKAFLKKFIVESEIYRVKLLEYTERIRQLDKMSLEIPLIESACFDQIFQFKIFCEEIKSKFFRTTYNQIEKVSCSIAQLPSKRSIFALKAQASAFDKINERKIINFEINGTKTCHLKKILVGRTLYPGCKGIFTYIKIYIENIKSDLIVQNTNVGVNYSKDNYYQEIEIFSDNIFHKYVKYCIEYEYEGYEGYTASGKPNEEVYYELIEKDSLFRSRVFGLDFEVINN